MFRRMLTLTAVLALSLTVGCSTTQKWMAGGAAIGAGTGAIWASHAMGALSQGHAALVGAAAGATAGALVGNIIEERETKAKIDQLNAEIARLKNELAAKDEALAAANRRIAELEAELARLRNQLKGASVRQMEIALGADVLFRPGSARLSEAGRRALDQAAQTIKSQYAGKFVMVEGHTDAQPIRVSGWKSNWELGAARSLTVLHYLNDKGVDAANLSAATFSKYQPVASNDTAQGRQQNRRAVIVIYSNWAKSTSTPAAPAK